MDTLAKPVLLLSMLTLAGCGDGGPDANAGTGGTAGTGGAAGNPANAAVLADCSGDIDVPIVLQGTPVSFEILDDKALMKGFIDADMPDLVDELLRDHPEVTTIAMTNVPGSNNDNATRAAGRKLRAAGLSTCLVRQGVIESGGVDFFLSGAKRKIIEGANVFVGVHAWADLQDRQATEYPEDDPVHRLFIDYYTEMGLDEGFYWFTINAAPFDEIHYMTKEERAEWGIETETVTEIEAPPEGQFAIEWTGMNDIDLEVEGPPGVTCRKTLDSTGGAEPQSEVVGCANDQGQAVSGIYLATVTNQSSNTQTSITFKSPRNATQTIDVTRDYAGGRVRSIFVARTTGLNAFASWLSDSIEQVNVDLRLYQSATYGQGPRLDITVAETWMDCTLTGSTSPGMGESFACGTIPIDVYQLEIFYDLAGQVPPHPSAGVTVRVSEGGEGFSLPQVVLNPMNDIMGYFLVAAGPVQ